MLKNEEGNPSYPSAFLAWLTGYTFCVVVDVREVFDPDTGNAFIAIAGDNGDDLLHIVGLSLSSPEEACDALEMMRDYSSAIYSTATDPVTALRELTALLYDHWSQIRELQGDLPF